MTFKTSRNIVVLDPESVLAIAAACPVPWHAAAIRFSAFTGLRLGELRAPSSGRTRQPRSSRSPTTTGTGSTSSASRGRPLAAAEGGVSPVTADTGSLLAAVDAHLATATPHATGTTDRYLAANRDRS